MDNIAMAHVLLRADAAASDIVREDLTLRVEQGLGIAKMRVARRGGDAIFERIAGFAAVQTGHQEERGTLTFAWMAPGEWLVTGPEADVAQWASRASASGGDEVLICDFTHARVAFELSGSNARGALAAHCPLDLWPGTFPEGAVARSLLGDTAMMIARLPDAADGPRFRIFVDQTMASYSWRLLASA